MTELTNNSDGMLAIDYDAIAKICHETNRAYCQTIGDNSQLPWDEAPEWQKTSAINGVKFHFSYDKTPEESHINWMKEKEKDGWIYGEEKDANKKTHPCMVPYNELPLQQRIKDKLFIAVVHTFSKINS